MNSLRDSYITITKHSIMQQCAHSCGTLQLETLYCHMLCKCCMWVIDIWCYVPENSKGLSGRHWCTLWTYVVIDILFPRKLISAKRILCYLNETHEYQRQANQWHMVLHMQYTCNNMHTGAMVCHGPLYGHGLNDIRSWISNHTDWFTHNASTHPCFKFNVGWSKGMDE